MHRRALAGDDRWKLDLLWPLASFSRKGGRFHSRFLPLWWHDADETDSLTVVPVLSSWIYRSGDLTSAGFVEPELAVKAEDMNSVVTARKPGDG